MKNIAYPITVLDKAQKKQKTVASVNMYVNLPHHFKGTHMSRFIEILNRFHGEINLISFQKILAEMKTLLQAEEAHMEVEFPYFLKKTHHSSAAVDIGEYRCKMHGSLDDTDDLTLEIRVPISPPLPAQIINGMPRSLGHWGIADICLRFQHFIWMEDVIQMVEEVTSQSRCWSAETAPAGDSYLTVETITKAIGNTFTEHPDIKWFSVKVENLSEGYTTFASLEWPADATGSSCRVSELLY